MVNIIFLTGKGAGSRRFQISRWYHLTLPLAAFTVCGSLILGAGYQWGKQVHGAADPRLAAWGEALQAQRLELEYTRDVAEADIRILTQRVAQLQAQMMRLEALGGKLVNMADLEDGEFDFGHPPGLGGPEELLPGVLPDLDLLRQLDTLARQLEDRESQLRLLSQLLLSAQLADEVTPAGRPVASGWISSGYGTRTDPFTGRQVFHRGVDFAGRPGTEILAVAGGIVIFADYHNTFGKLVEIDHGQGYVTRYAHNRAMRVAVGDTVRKGQVIAEMGATGRATGPHVHFEVLKDGRHMNPHRFINDAG
ncbi:Peptidase family M23 [Ectothiorhodospira magna]|uniref:Peptidase family M23 n=1 Tax=Ectothiorhodospira magna TaxID=867345 RepID=A0A1H8Z7X9_9GAMM|nr:M23 family metallopeptidase [Ectothiorhodospira magna]SEP60535.1 Peptidase family M23 [Ectothiorhodospira magna]